MECQALGAVKGQVTMLAEDGGLLEHVVVRTGCWLIPVARAASGAFAGVIGGIVRIITTVTFVAPIALIDEPSDFGAPLKVLVAFEQDDLVFSVRSPEYEEEGMVAAENFQLVGQVKAGKILLEFVQLWQATGTFWHPCCLVQLTRVDALPGKTSFKCVPVAAGHVMTVISMTPGPHRDDGARAAQFVLIVDGDDALFVSAVLIHGSQAHIPLARSTARGGHAHMDHVDLETPVRVKFLIRVKLPGQGIQ